MLLPGSVFSQTETSIPDDVKKVLFAACDCIDSVFAEYQPDFKAFLTSPDILLDDAEERYEALLAGLPEADQEWAKRNMEEIEYGDVDEEIENCVYRKFSEDYIDELDIDVDEDDEVLLKFLEETNCHLYYLLI
ncbi:MAG: hypothetical protein SchgKO_07480 [Schleiferiaceae bacterium]